MEITIFIEMTKKDYYKKLLPYVLYIKFAEKTFG
jgi:hypothetical protein